MKKKCFKIKIIKKCHNESYSSNITILKENRFQINFENQLLVTFDRFVQFLAS